MTNLKADMERDVKADIILDLKREIQSSLSTTRRHTFLTELRNQVQEADVSELKSWLNQKISQDRQLLNDAHCLSSFEWARKRIDDLVEYWDGTLLILKSAQRPPADLMAILSTNPPHDGRIVDFGGGLLCVEHEGELLSLFGSGEILRGLVSGQEREFWKAHPSDAVRKFGEIAQIELDQLINGTQRDTEIGLLKGVSRVIIDKSFDIDPPHGAPVSIYDWSSVEHAYVHDGETLRLRDFTDSKSLLMELLIGRNEASKLAAMKVDAESDVDDTPASSVS